MGREIRLVPADWNPLRDGYNNGKPHYDTDFFSAVAKWKAGYEEWKTNPQDAECEYWEWSGDPPDREYYRPAWPEESRTHLMLYSTTTEGTPMSPPFATPEELARWLADNKASTFGMLTTDYDGWLAFIHTGYAPSAVISGGALISGVEFVSTKEQPCE